MKTLQIITRPFRDKMIRQRSDNGFLCTTDLLNLYNKNRNINENEKFLADYFKPTSTQEYLTAVLKDCNENMENSLYFNTTKDLTMSTRGKNGGTYVHPLVFIDFAMWLSPTFKVWAAKVIMDKLIELRHIVGDEYKELTQAVHKYLMPTDYREYKEEAIMMNRLVWQTGEGKRNNATQEELDKLKKLQRADIRLLEKGIHDRTERNRILTKISELIF